MAWKAILRGPAREAAWEAIRAIRNDLIVAEKGIRNASLEGGFSGLAVCYAYLNEPDRCRLGLDRALDIIAAKKTGASLYGGFCGVAWALEHLRKNFPAIVQEIDSEEPDRVLESYLKSSPWNGHYDLILGLVGIGVYFLERLLDPAAVRCLQHIVDRLDETAERRGRYITWHTGRSLLTGSEGKRNLRGHYNLGVAHGVPGVIAFLGRVRSAGIRFRKASALLRGAVRWLRNQKLAPGSESCYPVHTGYGIRREPARSAWCYGDPGIAVALLSASRFAGEVEWEREALAIARVAAGRDPARSGVADPGICHGAAGLAHIFNRIFQATGDPVFRAAALLWFRQTLQYRKPGRGVGGFSVFSRRTNGKIGFSGEPGLLMGSAGIALCLLSAVKNVEPSWDRCLLTDL